MADNPGMVVQNIGAVTAYAYAVKGGYTGTLEQFQADLAKLADNVAEVRLGKEAAQQAAVNAGQSEKNAAASAASAEKSAEASATSAEEAKAASDLSVNGGAYILMEVGEDGCLYMAKTENAEEINFTLEDGNLIMEVIV